MKEKCRNKNGALKNSSINWIFFGKISLQNHPKLSITEKKRKKAEYLTWNSISLKFVKKTSMPQTTMPWVAPDMSKSFNSIRYNCQTISSWSRRPTDKEIEKRPHYSNWLTILLFKSFSKTFSNRPFPNILKYRDHWQDPPTIWKTKLFQTHIEEFS